MGSGQAAENSPKKGFVARRRPLAGRHRRGADHLRSPRQLIAAENLPLKIRRLHPCFGAEAGYLRRDTRGLIRHAPVQQVWSCTGSAAKASEAAHAQAHPGDAEAVTQPWTCPTERVGAPAHGDSRLLRGPHL